MKTNFLFTLLHYIQSFNVVFRSISLVRTLFQLIDVFLHLELMSISDKSVIKFL